MGEKCRYTIVRIWFCLEVFLPFQITSIGHILQGNREIEFNGFNYLSYLIVSSFNLGHVASKLIVATEHGQEEVLRKK